LSLYGAFERLPILGALACFSIVSSAAFTIYLYNRIAFGGALSSHFAVNVPDLTKREFVILISLVVPTIFYGIYPGPILDGLHYSVSTLIYASDEYTDLSMSFISLAFTTKRFLSKNTNKPLSSETTNLHPQFITGFVDAEGCFYLGVRETSDRKIGWRVSPQFTIELHKRDLPLLKSIQMYFKGAGNITVRTTRDQSVIYQCNQTRRDYWCSNTPFWQISVIN